MKGLFLNGFYSTISGIKLLLVLLLWAAAAVITGNATVCELFVYAVITALPLYAAAGMRRDAATHWDRFELTLPVRRRDIIRCKYVSYLFWVLIGAALAGAMAVATRLIHGVSVGILSTLVLGCGISLLAGALYFLLAHICGAQISEAILFLSVLGGIGLAVIFVNVLHALALSSRIGTAVLGVSCLALFALSYAGSAAVYSRREY